MRIIDIVIKKGCKGLVLAPNSNERKEIVTQLKRQGIPTVYIDRDIGGDRLSVIKTNNFKAGVLAGEKMVEALKGKGKVALLRLHKDVISTTAREEGFKQTVLEGGLEIVVDEFIGTRVGTARSKASYIFKNINNIDGIFTPNEVTSIAVLVTLQGLNVAGELIHIGFDSRKIMIDALKNNHMFGFIIQQPFFMGYEGVHNIHKVLEGRKIEEQIDSNVIFINKDNINEIK